VIARVNLADNVERIYAAGADFALSISQVSGQILAWRLLGKESVAVDPELRVVKVSSQGLENRQPADINLLGKTGCSVVAVERDDELWWSSRTFVCARRRDFYLRQRGSNAKICRAVPANIITNGSLSCAWEITSKSTKLSRQWLYI
jgi:hypothetical protein